MDDEGSSLAFSSISCCRNLKSRTGRLIRSVLVAQGHDQKRATRSARRFPNYLFGVFLVGRLRSLVRVPSKAWYSGLLGRNLAWPAASMRRFLSRRPLSFCVQPDLRFFMGKD